ncbi:hypothetical protein M6B38_299490 [Iris pallida]|uniref:Uncharacterized protein n=1 Tax=Iris pallida TaxID=29817 RepID=A0AAX6HPG2_IRIPA|nr:hypothetical protein M6B38_299490 [Iris pallida]
MTRTHGSGHDESFGGGSDGLGWFLREGYDWSEISQVLGKTDSGFAAWVLMAKVVVVARCGMSVYGGTGSARLEGFGRGDG